MYSVAAESDRDEVPPQADGLSRLHTATGSMSVEPPTTSSGDKERPRYLEKCSRLQNPVWTRFLAKDAEGAKKPSKCPKLLGELGALGERNSSARMFAPAEIRPPRPFSLLR